MVTLGLREGEWSAAGVVICSDGEVLDQFEASGKVPRASLDLKHAGWVMGACEAMRRCLASDRPLALELNLAESAPVGFLVVTLPSRPQLATWSEDTQKAPWPGIYQEFLDLTAKVNPKIRWRA